LRISRAQALERAVKAVRHAKSLCKDVEFSTEDGGRSDRDYLVEVIGAVIEAGATTINVPDTVGYTLPSEYGSLFEYLIARTPGAKGVVWSTHCHDDLGLAVSNSLAAVLAGARQVECTVNGIGERAGNTSLEEVVMTLTTRPLFFPVTHGIVTSQIMRSSKMVSKLTGMLVQPNKAIVGANAFAHESGIHQDGMLKNASTYEIMTPASVGVVGGTTLVLGKHSGRAAYAQRVRELGFTLDAAQLDVLTEKLKMLADEKKVVTDADIESLVTSDVATPDVVWSLVRAHVFTGTDAKPTATVTMRKVGGEEVSTSALGSGPVDAVYNAIKSVVGRGNDLTGFSVRSVTDGTMALGEVTIKIQPAGEGMGRRSVKGLQRIGGAGGADAGSAAVKEWEEGDANSGGGSPTYSGVAAGASSTHTLANEVGRNAFTPTRPPPPPFSLSQTKTL
jgi:2-isopropylmalate synthase